MEYMLHRFTFHAEDKWLPKHPKAVCMHFIFHGVHHAFPMDAMRLVFPPSASLLLYFFIFRPLIQLFFAPDWWNCVSAGIMIGYQCYDMIHYWTHHTSYVST